MGRKSTSPPSKLWLRLIEGLQEQGLPITQNGVAKLVGRPHRTVWDWYHNQGEPDISTYRMLALKGKVSVDWLITGRQPKYPISRDPLLSKILEGCGNLDEEARKRILQAVRQELIRKTGEGR